MCGGICGIDELTSDDAAGDLAVELIGFVDRALHAQFARSQDDFCAVSGN